MGNESNGIMLQINREALDRILEDFYDLTKIRVTFWDTYFRKVRGSCWHSVSDFCAKIQQNPKLMGRCKKCEQDAIQDALKDNGHLRCFHCHAGMNEFILPVLYHNQLLGYFMYGQSRLQDFPDDIVSRNRVYQEFGLDRDHMEEEYKKLPVKSYAEMEAAGRILIIMARYSFFNEIIKNRNYTNRENIEYYLNKYYMEKINIQALCDSLFVSRSTICHVIQKEMNTTFTELLNSIRINQAKKLLQSGKTMEEIAEEVGFGSANYMNRVFKRMKGISPSEYKRNNIDE